MLSAPGRDRACVQAAHLARAVVMMPARRLSAGLHAFFGASADDRDVLRLRSLLALGDVELDLLAFLKGAVAAPIDRAEVHEHVGATLNLDETVALLGVEPLHIALRHLDLLRCGCGAGVCTRTAWCVGEPTACEPVWGNIWARESCRLAAGGPRTARIAPAQPAACGAGASPQAAAFQQDHVAPAAAGSAGLRRVGARAGTAPFEQDHVAPAAVMTAYPLADAHLPEARPPVQPQAAGVLGEDAGLDGPDPGGFGRVDEGPQQGGTHAAATGRRVHIY